MLTFEIDSENALVGNTIERCRSPLISAPISEDLKLLSTGGIFQTPQHKCEMLASMPRGGRRPTYLATQYI
jgi:hypothetical protein